MCRYLFLSFFALLDVNAFAEVSFKVRVIRFMPADTTPAQGYLVLGILVDVYYLEL